MTDIDFGTIAELVAAELLGEPNRRLSRGTDWRYGNRGSLSVDVDRAVWRDHETGEGGGLLDLIEREVGCDRAGSLAWLRSRGYLPRRAPLSLPGGRRGSRMRATSVVSRSRSRRSRSGPIRLARSLWAASDPVPGTPGDVYLHGRGVWPASWYRFDAPCLGDVGWLSRASAPRSDPEGSWFGLRADLAGLLLFAFRSPATGEVQAVLVEGLDEQGCRPGNRWRRMFGAAQGALFEARAGDGVVHVAEGPLDALALVWAPWFETRGGCVVSVGGTSGLAGLRAKDVPDLVGGTGTVVLHPDGDEDGACAVAQAQAHIQAAGKRCRIRRCPAGLDPADELAAWLRERAAALENDRGRDRAVYDAWVSAVRLARRQCDGLKTRERNR